MKNMTILFLLFFVGVSMTASAQDTKGDIFLEVGLGYGSEIQSLGIQAGGLYTINSQFRGSADILYFIPGKDSNGVEFSWLEINTNGHFLFVDQENLNIYALSGLNFAMFYSDQSDIHLPGGDSTDTLYFGLNIGAGVEFSLGSIYGYAEGKYALSSAHQLALTGGVRIPIVN